MKNNIFVSLMIEYEYLNNNKSYDNYDDYFVNPNNDNYENELEKVNIYPLFFIKPLKYEKKQFNFIYNF